MGIRIWGRRFRLSARGPRSFREEHEAVIFGGAPIRVVCQADIGHPRASLAKNKQRILIARELEDTLDHITLQEKMCYVASDYESELAKSTDSSPRAFELPDGSRLLFLCLDSKQYGRSCCDF